MYRFEIVYDKSPHYTSGKARTLKDMAFSINLDLKDRGLLTVIPENTDKIETIKRLILSEKSVLSFLFERI
jgi:hypothetical protein